MSNPFKSANKITKCQINLQDERVKCDSKHMNYRNSQFKNSNEPPKKIYYEMNIDDFPEITSNAEVITENINNKVLLDFKNASLKEADTTNEICEVLTPGWLHMKYNKNTNKFMKKEIKNDETKKNTNNKLIFEIQVNNAINSIIERQQHFIGNYGVDKYEKDYHIESYWEMSNKYDDDYEYDYDSENSY
jgi:hypothetical protein